MNNKPLDKTKAEAELKSLWAKGIDSKDSQGRTPLILAFEQERFDLAKELISKGANLNVKDNQGRTPLMIALQKGQTEMAILLISNGADISILSNSNVITPQFLKEHPEIVKYITTGGNSSEMLSTTTSLVLNGEDISKEAVQDYIAHGGDVNDVINRDGQTYLMLASQKDDAQTAQWLIDNGANVNQQDKKGQTSLMFSAMKGFVKTQKVLLENGADPNIQDQDGKTAFMFSAQENQLESAKMLVEYKADINLKDKDGKTAFMIAAEKGNLDILVFLNEDCIEKENTSQNQQEERPKESKKLPDNLTKEPKKPDEKKENKENKNQEDTDAKEKKDTKDNSNNNNNGDDHSFSFHTHIQTDLAQTATKQERKKYYVAKRINLNEQDNNGETALMLAARAGRKEVFSYLAQQNDIDFSIKNKQGKSILDIVQESNDRFYAELLREIEVNLSELPTKRFSSEDIEKHLNQARSHLNLSEKSRSTQEKPKEEQTVYPQIKPKNNYYS